MIEFLRRTVVEKAKIPDFTWHCLDTRWPVASLWRAWGIRMTAELMGYKKIQMTMRHAHLAPAHKLAAVDKLAASNAVEKTRQGEQELDILTTAEPENPETLLALRLSRSNGFRISR